MTNPRMEDLTIEEGFWSAVLPIELSSLILGTKDALIISSRRMLFYQRVLPSKTKYENLGITEDCSIPYPEMPSRYKRNYFISNPTTLSTLNRLKSP